jgi:hypothetical protein
MKEEKEEIVKDGLKFKTLWTIYKWKDPKDEISAFLQHGGKIEDAISLFGKPFGIESIEGNLALNEGIGELLDLICGLGSPTKWDSTHAYLGVGENSTTEAATQTGLQGSTTTFKGMDSTFPSRSGQTVTWQATFGSGDANIHWQEYTVVNASSDTGKNLNRKVQDKSTKVTGESWTLVLQLTPA